MAREPPAAARREDRWPERGEPGLRRAAREREDYVRPEDATAEPLRRELDRYREAVQIARTVMSFDRGRHEVTLGRTLIDTLLTETQASRAVGRLLDADAAIRVLDGDPDGASTRAAPSSTPAARSATSHSRSRSSSDARPDGRR